jgi:16S rRNA processing protein RimM
LIEYGRVAGSYGVRGWLKVAVDEPGWLAQQPKWWLKGAEYQVEQTKVHSGLLLAKLGGIDSPEAAKDFKGAAVVIPRPAAGEGEIYADDLVGLQVVNEQGVALGKVKQVTFNGAHEVIELEGERTRLLPLVPAYVKRIDAQNGRIEVEWDADW